MTELPTGTVTFLFSDIEGSTQLLQRLGDDDYARVLGDHQALLRAAWAAHGGGEVETAGDGFLVAFPSAPAAVAAAAQATRVLAAHPWPAGTTVQVRIGLHTGTPQLVGDHYVGLDVHRAARIAAAGHGGQVLLSADTEALVENQLPQGAVLRDLGAHRLKDLEHAEHLYQLVLLGLPADFPPLKTAETRPHDLPPRAPGFVGRQQEVAEIAASLRQGRAVAILGMGGLGKSSLAAEAVHALANEPGAFPGGVTWVRCDDRTGLEGQTWIEDQLLAAWSASLSAEATARAASPQEGLELRERALRERLRPEGGAPPAPALVLLDNVERDLLPARLLDTLTPLGITTVLTSRVEPSSPRLRLLRLEVLPRDASIQLFAERFTARGGTWSAERDQTTTRAIVDTLGDLPLAIELAAARAARTYLSLASLAEELRAPDALARLNDPSDPSASVRYSLRKTLLILTPSQRLRFAALGLPEGSDWPHPTIERMLAGVAAAAPDQLNADRTDGPPSARADLEALVAYSLVGLVAGDRSSAPRVRLHPLVRELAHEEWGQLSAGDQQAALEALLAGVRSWVGAYQIRDAEFYRVLAQDDDLIAGALRTAMVRQIGLPQVTSIIAAWGSYLFVRNERLDYEMRSLQVESAHATGDPRAELAALNGLIQISGLSGREDEAARLRRRALILARDLGDQVEILRMLGAMGEEMAARGSRAEAEHLYAEAQALARVLGDRFTDFDALNNLGNAARALDRLDEAVGWYQRAMASAQAADDLLYEVMSKSNLALVYDQLGQLADARTLLEEMEQVRFPIDYPYGLGSARNAQGQLALKMGDLDAAAGYLTQALPTLEQSGHAEMVAQARANLILLAGLQALRHGDREAAVQAFEQALQQFEAIGRLSDAADQRPFVRQLLADLHAPPVASAPASASAPSSVSTPASAAVPVAGDGSSTRTTRMIRRRWPWSRR
jgi:class 3 adenylate cyclase/tetratricopeptide (TPR) repeat protein